MGKRNSNYQINDFYCLNCGNKALPLARKCSHQHGQLHRKALYCPICKVEVNCVEIRTQEEKDWFIKEFNKGVFKEEAQASINYIKNSKERDDE